MAELQTTQLPWGIHIQRNDKNRVIIIDNNIVVFTPTEYRLLTLLLTGNIITAVTFVTEVFDCKEIDKSIKNLLKKHIENVKSKLKPVNLDVYRVHKKGYVLMLVAPTEAIP